MLLYRSQEKTPSLTHQETLCATILTCQMICALRYKSVMTIMGAISDFLNDNPQKGIHAWNHMPLQRSCWHTLLPFRLDKTIITQEAKESR